MPVQKSHSDTFFDLPFMVSMISLEREIAVFRISGSTLIR